MDFDIDLGLLKSVVGGKSIVILLGKMIGQKVALSESNGSLRVDEIESCLGIFEGLECDKVAAFLTELGMVGIDGERIRLL
jgi:hypothetical protein